MLVDVVELRVLGVRRPRDEVRAALPVRGVLSLTSARAGRFAGQKNPPLLAGLANAEKAEPWLLQPLDQACVRAIRGGNVVIAGLQQTVLRGRVHEVYLQAWWCQLVSGVPVELPGQPMPCVRSAASPPSPERADRREVVLELLREPRP